MPIDDLRTRLPRVGRISTGRKVKGTRQDGSEYTRPKKEETLVFSSDSRDLLDAVAAVYGGNVEEAPAANDGAERFVVVSAVTEIPVVIPSVADESLVLSQYMELHSASGIRRRCTGSRVTLIRDTNKETGEVTIIDGEETEIACICKEQGLEGEDACKPVLRLSVLLPDLLDAPGLGVWVISSSGWRSNEAVNASLELLRGLMPGRQLPMGMPLTLAAKAATAQVYDAKKHKMVSTSFRHFALGTRISWRQAFEAAGSARQGIGAALGFKAEPPAPADPTPADPEPEPDPPTEEPISTEEETPDEGGAAPADHHSPAPPSANLIQRADDLLGVVFRKRASARQNYLNGKGTAKDGQAVSLEDLDERALLAMIAELTPAAKQVAS